MQRQSLKKYLNNNKKCTLICAFLLFKLTCYLSLSLAFFSQKDTHFSVHFLFFLFLLKNGKKVKFKVDLWNFAPNFSNANFLYVTII